MWVQQLVGDQSDKTLAAVTASASARATVTAKEAVTAGPGWLPHKLRHQTARPLTFHMRELAL